MEEKGMKGDDVVGNCLDVIKLKKGLLKSPYENKDFL